MRISKYQGIPDYAVKNKSDKLALEKGFTWDPSEATRVKNFIERFCPQSKGGWTGNLKLLPFQLEDIIFPFYSWKKPNGKPRFDSLYWFGPRKHGKSQIGASLAAYHLCTENRSEILTLASTVEQSKIIYTSIANFNQNPVMEKRLHIKDHKNEIIDRKTKGKLKVISSTNVQGTSGWNSSLILFDEWFEVRHSIAIEIWSRLKNSNLARKNADGRKFVISTPQEVTHPGKKLFDYAHDIKNGDTVDFNVLPVLYGADPDDDPGKESTWKKAQPALGSIITLDAYRQDWNQSKDSAHELVRFKTLLLGMFVSAVDSWISTHAFGEIKEDYKEEDFYDCDVVGGFDWGGRSDFLCWCWLAFKDEKLHIIPRFALPRKVIERKAQYENSDYMGWTKSGLIKVCEGETIDIDWWHEQLEEDFNLFNVQAIAIDDFRLEATRQWIEEEYSIDVIGIKTWQYNDISPLTNLFESMIKDKQIVHNDNPILNWMMENTTIKIDDSGKIKPDKKKGSAKIDIIITIIIALAAKEYLEQNNDFCGIL